MGLSSPTHGVTQADEPMDGILMSENIIVKRQVGTVPAAVDVQTRQQVEVLAASQQLTYDQLKQFWDEHQALRRDTGEAFGHTSEALQQQRVTQAALVVEVEHQGRVVAQQQEQLKVASDVVAKQQEQLQAASAAFQAQQHEVASLKAAVLSPRGQARWGMFAGEPIREETMEANDGGESRQQDVLIAGGGMPIAPVYKGSTKKEKREFMDKYLSYQRRVDAINECTGRRMVLMPLASCIEHRTMTRILMFEMKRTMSQVTEENWRAYFAAARAPTATDYDTVEAAMRSLKMDVSSRDPESRVWKLIAEFQEKLEGNDMETFLFEEPKLCVKMLCNALQPSTLRDAVRKELKKEINRKLKSDVSLFVDWLTGMVASFMKFESSIPRAAPIPKPTVGKFQDRPGTNDGHRGKERGKDRDKKDRAPAAGAVAGGQDEKPAEKPERRNKCLKCQSTEHGVFRCPKADRAEATRLWDAWKAKRDERTAGAVEVPSEEQGCGRASVAPSRCVDVYVDGLKLKAKLDTGADVCVISPGVVKELEKRGVLREHRFKEPKSLRAFSGDRMEIVREVCLDLCVPTECGDLRVRDVRCWVAATPMPPLLGDLLLSSGVMRLLGFHEEAFLSAARQRKAEYHMGAVAGEVEDEEMQEMESLRFTPELHRSKEAEEEEVLSLLESKCCDALADGASEEFVKELRKLLRRYRDVFRTVLGRDPPVKVDPLVVRLKPNHVPVKCKSRRYPQEHRVFMREHIQSLVDAGLCYRNNRSRWCSPPLIVKKKEAGQFRMTVDVRAVNAQTEVMLWPMPILEVVMDHLHGARVFFVIDFFKGYWQLALARESQELFSILTDEGIYTPMRVLMGGSDSVAFCQAAVQEIFAKYLYKGLMAWLDDVLGYEVNEKKLLCLLEATLEICEERGLKLNPAKCEFYKEEVKWCGRIISASGVKHDPKRIDALCELAEPKNGKELQQYICAMNWMRSSIPGYNRLVGPMQQCMEAVYQKAGGRTRSSVARVELDAKLWGREQADCFVASKDALKHAVELAHPDMAQRLCVFTDASDRFWGAVITQVPEGDTEKAVEDQRHQPLMFLSGTFSGAASRWATVEKEAFALVETVKRADYLLHRPGGFRLCTDHLNLRYIFNPASVLSAVPKYTADKLQRWSMVLMGYQYEIMHIPGEDNVWADLLSRWGCERSVCAVSFVESPQLNSSFVWPNLVEIVKLQEKYGLRGVTDDAGLQKDADGRVLIPTEAKDLVLRLCVVAHNGVAGHQGMANTVKTLADLFWWPTLKEDVEKFVRECLHCLCTRGGAIQPRPWGEQVHGTKPNEVLHFDFLYLGLASTGKKYVLVLKDDASKYVWLRPAAVADSEVVIESLLEWFAAFGPAYVWVTDQGSHFKNHVVRGLQHALGAHHHFVTAYCPWANGTVEAANRCVLRVFRSLLSEWRLDASEWMRLAPLVQLVVNHTRRESLGGEAPVTGMTGLPAMSPVAPIVCESGLQSTTLEEVQAMQGVNVAELVKTLDGLHKKMVEKAKSTRGRKKNSSGRHVANFALGDYVLLSCQLESARPKLQVVWKGPCRVVAVSSDWVFEVENLVTGKVITAHASRLKRYADSDLGNLEEVKKQACHSEVRMEVKSFTRLRYDAAKARWELEVHWLGMEPADATWEPATVMLEDVPVLFRNFVARSIKSHKLQKLCKQMCVDLGLDMALSGGGSDASAAV